MNCRERIGEIGEQFVQEFHGPLMIMSEDKYDSKKDAVYAASLLAEIKTMTCILKGDEYWLEYNQYNKVTSVDLLFIVDIPLYEKDGATIYLCPNNKELKLENRVKERNVTKMVVIPKNKLYKLTIIKNDDRVKEMVHLSDLLSSFRRKLKGII